MPSLEQKVILVTGGTGLVGNAIRLVVEEEMRRGGEEISRETWFFVGTKDADLRNPEETQRLFDKYKPTHVINLAAEIGGLFLNMKRNLDFFLNNLAINNNVLEMCHKTGVSKVVSCLSTCVFPDRISYPLDEGKLHEGEPHPSNFGYSYGKRLIDVLNRGYHQQHGRNFTSVIPCNVIGPHDNYTLVSSHVIPAITRKMLEAAERGDATFTVLGSGKPLRQFVYSLDLAKLMLWALRTYDSAEPIILSVDEDDEISIAEAAQIIKETVGFKGELVFDTSKADGQHKKTASNSKLRKYLPDFKFTRSQEAIRLSALWYMQNRKIARH